MKRRIFLRATLRDHQIAGFAALAIVIHILEAGVPTPIPGIKPGLANVITLVVLLRHDLRAAIWVQLLRVLVGSLLIGSFLTPTFLLSLSGALGSLAVLALMTGWNHVARPVRLGPIGLGVAAACAHMGGQFCVAYAVFIPHPGLLTLLPVLLTAAMLFGALTGWLAGALCERLQTEREGGGEPG
ncbi:Gx transporter family protein [uncultured Abyssibacter sp.]|uniref:Gx transporter family protein n=1 Tax=uncultured Abyssibacter sp. TaxID=2320202 RepID=UPI0032B2D788